MGMGKTEDNCKDIDININLPPGAPEGCRFAAAGPNNVRQILIALRLYKIWK